MGGGGATQVHSRQVLPHNTHRQARGPQRAPTSLWGLLSEHIVNFEILICNVIKLGEPRIVLVTVIV